MKRSYNITFMIGMAYIALALSALTNGLPQRLINALSLGAVLLSISELLMAINSRRMKKRSILSVLEQSKCKDKYDIAILYIKEIMKEKHAYIKNQNSVLAYVSILLNVFAFWCMLVYPHTDFLPFLDDLSKFGAFCTVISLGIVFLSITVNNDINFRQEILDDQELFDAFLLANDEADLITEKALKQVQMVNNREKTSDSKRRELRKKRKYNKW